MDEMACGNRTIETTAVRIWHRVSRTPARRSQLLQNFTMIQVNSWSILNAPPSLQVLLEAPENALAESESTVLSSRGAWKHLEVLRSTGQVNRSVWDVCVELPDWFTFRWWICAEIRSIPIGGVTSAYYVDSFCRANFMARNKSSFHTLFFLVKARMTPSIWSNMSLWTVITWCHVTICLVDIHRVNVSNKSW